MLMHAPGKNKGACQVVSLILCFIFLRKGVSLKSVARMAVSKSQRFPSLPSAVLGCSSLTMLRI